MPQLCLYFQLHQPYRLQEFNVFDLDRDQSYFRSVKLDTNQQVFQKVAQKSYLPMLTLLNQLIDSEPDFYFTFSCSGVFLEQARLYDPDVITLLQNLVNSGRVEVLAETYYHSLSSIYSPTEFNQQVQFHTELIDEIFNFKPQVFRNTELIYSNEVGKLVANLGFKAMLTEAVDRYLADQPRTQLFSNTDHNLILLLKHAQLSDDIAFRFSDKNWSEYPLTETKYLDWLEVNDEYQLINLFMDFETFGEHQWQDTGIFEFFTEFVEEFSKKSWNAFVTPSQVIQGVQPKKLPIYNVPQPISWADIDRDLTAWIDSPLQQDCLRIMYELEKQVLNSQDHKLIKDWRLLQTSDHFYYMCTKWSADGDVHAYFSPYDSPYEAYRRYAIVLADLKKRLGG